MYINTRSTASLYDILMSVDWHGIWKRTSSSLWDLRDIVSGDLHDQILTEQSLTSGMAFVLGWVIAIAILLIVWTLVCLLSYSRSGKNSYEPMPVSGPTLGASIRLNYFGPGTTPFRKGPDTSSRLLVLAAAGDWSGQSRPLLVPGLRALGEGSLRSASVLKLGI